MLYSTCGSNIAGRNLSAAVAELMGDPSSGGTVIGLRRGPGADDNRSEVASDHVVSPAGIGGASIVITGDTGVFQGLAAGTEFTIAPVRIGLVGAQRLRLPAGRAARAVARARRIADVTGSQRGAQRPPLVPSWILMAP